MNRKVKLPAHGMNCTGCEIKIEKKLKTLNGIINVKANYSKEEVSVEYNSNEISLSKIRKSILKWDIAINLLRVKDCLL